MFLKIYFIFKSGDVDVALAMVVAGCLRGPEESFRSPGA